jgi:glycosyltransferase involved in cell wall biosynthesis
MSATARRPRIAFFTPLPPVPSGIAQYSAELLPLLALACDIDVYIDNYRPTAPVPGVRGVLRANRFEREQARRPYDALVYQMGNSPAHSYMWPLAMRYPGLLVLHDFVLHHLQLWMAVNRRGVRQYRAEMHRRYGVEGDTVAASVLRGRMPGEVFEFPLCEGIVAASPWVAVHSRYAAHLVTQRCQRDGVAVLPMGVPAYRLPEADQARDRLGLPRRAPVVASLGQVSPHKRMDVALRAFRRVRERYPAATFVIAGAESPGVDLDRLVTVLALEDAVVRLGYVAEASVADVLAAADVVVNLRYPTAGETSASLLRILAAGKAVITSRAGSMAEVPSDACATVLPDEVEEELIALLLERLLGDETLRRQMEANARVFIAREHQLAHAAAAYLQLISRVTGQALAIPAWPVVEIDARAGGPPLRLEKPATAVPEPAPHRLADQVAGALVDLGLARAPAVVRRAAAAMADLGLAPDGDATEQPAMR